MLTKVLLFLSLIFYSMFGYADGFVATEGVNYLPDNTFYATAVFYEYDGKRYGVKPNAISAQLACEALSAGSQVYTFKSQGISSGYHFTFSFLVDGQIDEILPASETIGFLRCSDVQPPYVPVEIEESYTLEALN